MLKMSGMKTAIAGLISACLSLALIAVPGQAALATSACVPDSSHTPMVLEFAPDTAIFDLELPLDNFSGDIDWGDGSSGSFVGTVPVHGYVNLTPNNPFYVCIKGTADSFGAPNAPIVYDPNWLPSQDPWEGVSGLTRVSQWGNLGLISLASAFNGANHLYCVADNMTDPVMYMNYTFQGASLMDWNCSYPLNFNGWDTSHVKTMSNMFSGATRFNGQLDAWDTSNVENMNEMFAGAELFNQSLPFVPDPDPSDPNDHAQWDTSSVEIMSYMFDGALNFNSNINNWDTSSVVFMNGMFRGAEDFNQNIGTWDTSNVLFLQEMFSHATSFNRNLPWSTSSVWDMSEVFAGASAFQGDISSWDTSSVGDMSCMFCGATHFNQPLNYSAGPDPNDPVTGSHWYTGNVSSMESMFEDAEQFDQDLSDWNTGSVMNMDYMFAGAQEFGHYAANTVDNWDTSAVIFMTGVFSGAENFNGHVSNWDTKNVAYMDSMFEDAYAFNQDISDWDTHNVEDMSWMFVGASSFNQPLTYVPASVIDPNDPYAGSKWYTGNVTWMESMFQGATDFDGDISNWNTGLVESMAFMFDGATSFTQDLSSWDTSSVEDMAWMFNGATNFNGDVTTWDTSRVHYMTLMFAGTHAFNQDLSGWDTSHVESMHCMFYGSTAFNQDLSDWNIMYLNDAGHMFVGSMMSTLNYSKILRSWASQPHQSGMPDPIYLDASAQYFSTVEADRQSLIDDGWVITDAGSITAMIPTITSNPSASSITAGQHLSASTLSGGSASQPGTFGYTNPNSTPAAGTISAAVTFYPDDDIQYETATTNVSVVVNAAPAPQPTPTPAPQNDAASLASTGSALGWAFQYALLFLACGVLIVAKRRNASHEA